MGALLLPFAGGLSSRVSWRVCVRPVIADDGLHRAYGERGAFLTADGERDGAQNHAILRGTKTPSIHAFASRAAAPFRPRARRRRVQLAATQPQRPGSSGPSLLKLTFIATEAPTLIGR